MTWQQAGFVLSETSQGEKPTGPSREQLQREMLTAIATRLNLTLPRLARLPAAVVAQHVRDFSGQSPKAEDLTPVLIKLR